MPNRPSFTCSYGLVSEELVWHDLTPDEQASMIRQLGAPDGAIIHDNHDIEDSSRSAHHVHRAE